MSYFEDASLVLIPSAVKISKAYAIKPTDGSGDLTFTRSNDTASRVASNGLIEKLRTNLVLQSNTFSDASWNKTYQGVGSVAVVTPNYTTDPFGGNNAWRFQCNLNGGTTASDRSWMLQPFTPTADTILSIYIKLNVAGSKTIFLSNGGGDAQTITSTDWVRINFVTGPSSGEFRIGLLGGSTSDTLDCSIAFAQAETGDIATDYIATTSAAVSVGPVANLPRLDYSGGATCPKLLLEGQRTNLVPYSEQLSQWSLANATLTSNDAISPDGYQNADKIVTSSVACDVKYTNVSVSASTTYTASFWVKLTSGTGLEGRFYDNTNGANIEYYTYDSQITIGEWSRVTRTFTTPAGCTNIQVWYLASSSSASVTAHFWGFQCEAGYYETSYIPTLGSASTRGADMSGTTNYFGAQTFAGDFTFFVDLLPMEGNTGTSDAMILGGGDYTGGGDFQSYLRFASGNIILRGVAEAVMITRGYTMNANQQYKTLVTRTGTTVKIFANGAQVGASATSSATVILRSLGWSYSQVSYNYDGRINQVLLMPSALTDAQAIELTTI